MGGLIGRTYDLTAEPGRSLWLAVAERPHATPSPAAAGPGELGGGWSDPAPGRRRLRQGTEIVPPETRTA